MISFNFEVKKSFNIQELLHHASPNVMEAKPMHFSSSWRAFSKDNKSTI
jgi:hypothetical protein